MMKIIVKGKGLIPRGYGLAPRLTPFNASFDHIAIMLATGTFQLETIDPDTKKPVIITKHNFRKLYSRHQEVKKSDIRKETTPAPVQVQDKVVEEKPNVEPMVEEVKPIISDIKPVEIKTEEVKAEEKPADNDILKPMDSEHNQYDWKKKNRK
jgi:hypothetical protein